MVHRIALFWTITQRVEVNSLQVFSEKLIESHVQGSCSHLLRGVRLKSRPLVQFPTEQVWSWEYIRYKRKHKATCMTSLFQDGQG